MQKNPKKHIHFISWHLWWYGSILVYMAWITCTINAKRYIQVLEQTMFLFRKCLLCLFQKDNVKPAWLLSKRAQVLSRLACSLDLSPIANIWCIMKQKIRQRTPWTLEKLKSFIKQEEERKLLSELQQLVLFVSKHLQSGVKRRVDATHW